jgi:hypothetical protein
MSSHCILVLSQDFPTFLSTDMLMCPLIADNNDLYGIEELFTNFRAVVGRRRN